MQTTTQAKHVGLDNMHIIAADIEADGLSHAAEPTSHVFTRPSTRVISGIMDDDGTRTAERGLDAGYHVTLRPHDDHPLTDADANALQETLAEETDSAVTLSVVSSVAEFIDDLYAFTDEFLLNDDAMLTYYNGDPRRGNGYDLPLLRLTAHRVDKPFPFNGVQFRDAKDAVDNGRIPTTSIQFGGKYPVKSTLTQCAERYGIDVTDMDKQAIQDTLNSELSQEEIETWARETDNDIPTSTTTAQDDIYEILGGSTEADPFEDSVEAVAAWQNGEYRDLLRHNILDVDMTTEVMSFIQKSCTPYDFSPTRLGV